MPTSARLLQVLVLAVLATAIAPPSPAQVSESFALDHSVPASAPLEFYSFGERVFLGGDWLAVHDALFPITGPGGIVRVGTLHMYRRTTQGWEFVQHILPPILPQPGEPQGLFGSTCTIAGDRMAIGGSVDALNQYAGTVWTYWFDGTAWLIDERIESPIARAGASFGWYVILVGQDLYIAFGYGGTPDPSMPTAYSGSIERYSRSSGAWLPAESILPFSSARPLRYCSGPFAVGGDHLVTRCAEGPYPSQNPYLRIFERDPSGWVEVALLDGPDPALYTGIFERFAVAIGAWDDWIAVGVPISSYIPPTPAFGSEVWIYHRSTSGTWSRTQRLSASDGWIGWFVTSQASDEFGYSLSFDDGRLLVGATKGRNTAGQRGKGAAYVFELQGSTWVETRRLTSTLIEDPSYAHGSWFGCGVAIDGDYIAVSDSLASQSPVGVPDHTGRAYVYEEEVSSPTCVGVPNPTGAPASLRAVGSSVSNVGVLTFEGAALPAGAGAVLFAGTSAGFTANPGGSAGNLCLSGAAQRLAIGPAGAAGDWSAAIELEGPTVAGALSVLPGESRHFQLWYRQPGAPPTSNFSSGIRVDFR